MQTPLFIRHRVNTVAGLEEVRKEWGVELDIRSRDGSLVLNHEPHAAGDSLEEFLARVKARGIRGPLVLNTKEDGHELAILALLKQKKLTNFFFLDTAFPTLVRLTINKHVPHVAVRVSEYEPYLAVSRFKGAAAWVWLDCFSGKPPSLALVKRISQDFKICLVSPELQGYPPERIALFRPLAPYLDAVCSKHPDLWK